MRFSNIVLVYFVVGAVMWGGGAINWDNSGIAVLFVETPGDGVETNDQTVEDLGQMGGPIQQAAQSLSGGLIAIWNILAKLIGYLFWPIIVLESNNAPARIIVLLGGTPTVAFYGSVIRLVRTSG